MSQDYNMDQSSGSGSGDETEVLNILSSARDYPKGSEERKSLALLLSQFPTSNPTAIPALLLVSQHILEFYGEFSEETRVDSGIDDAVWDLCESEVVEVRMAGVKTMVQIAERTRSAEFAKTSVELLIQTLILVPPTPSGQQESLAMKEALSSMMITNPSACAANIAEHINDFSSDDNALRRGVVWGFLDGESQSGRLGRAWVGEEGEEGCRIFMQATESSLEQSDPATRVKALRFLMSLPTISSPSAPQSAPTWLLSHIINCCLDEPDSTSSHPYLYLIDDLESLVSGTHKPDPRYYLKLFQSHPHSTFEWARKSVTDRKGLGSPSRVYDWLTESWVIWAKERVKGRNGSGSSGVGQDLSLGELGVKCAQTAISQIPLIVSQRATLASIVSHLEDAEVHLAIAYYLFDKLNAQIPNFYDDITRNRIQLLISICEDGTASLKNGVSSSVTIVRWQTIQRWCKNIISSPPKREAVPPAWEPLSSSKHTPAPLPLAATSSTTSSPAPSPNTPTGNRQFLPGGPRRTTARDGKSTPAGPSSTSAPGRVVAPIPSRGRLSTGGVNTSPAATPPPVASKPGSLASRISFGQQPSSASAAPSQTPMRISSASKRKHEEESVPFGVKGTASPAPATSTVTSTKGLRLLARMGLAPASSQAGSPMDMDVDPAPQDSVQSDGDSARKRSRPSGSLASRITTAPSPSASPSPALQPSSATLKGRSLKDRIHNPSPSPVPSPIHTPVLPRASPASVMPPQHIIPSQRPAPRVFTRPDAVPKATHSPSFTSFSPSHPPPMVPVDDGIVRKGRGFSNQLPASPSGASGAPDLLGSGSMQQQQQQQQPPVKRGGFGSRF